MAAIGLDLGATKLAGAIFSEAGEIDHRIVESLGGRNGDDVGRLITAQVSALLTHARSQTLAINALGVSVPGIYRINDGTVWAPNIEGWERYPLKVVLHEHV